jgi:transposase
MIGLPSQIRVWAYPGPCDMRKGHNGLLGLVERHFCRDILGGDLFLFVNRRRTLSKTLYWDGSGYVILYKRRVEGKFPKLWDRDDVDPTGIRLSAAELALFLDGCQLLAKESLRSP